MTLQYLPPDRLGLGAEELPRSSWPRPRRHLPPFHDGFTDYVRAVAPGVYVGCGPACSPPTAPPQPPALCGALAVMPGAYGVPVAPHARAATLSDGLL